MPSIYEQIDKIIDALTWVVIIVAGYMVLEALNQDDDPDGYA